MFRKPNPASGVPIYVQLKEQILHAIEIGSLAPGNQLPGIRSLAESLIVNPNTIVRVYHELEQEGVLEVRHGLGAFVARRRGNKFKSNNMMTARQLVRATVDKLRNLEFDESAMRRLFEAELTQEEILERR